MSDKVRLARFIDAGKASFTFLYMDLVRGCVKKEDILSNDLVIVGFLISLSGAIIFVYSSLTNVGLSYFGFAISSFKEVAIFSFGTSNLGISIVFIGAAGVGTILPQDA